MKQVLITGGDGYIARALGKALLEQGGYQLHLLLRPENKAQKLMRLQSHFGTYFPQLSIAWGDLTTDHPFAEVDTQAIEYVIHTAAAIEFNISRETANDINIEGSRKLFELCRQLPNLQRVLAFSSLYASGLQHGLQGEQRWSDGEGFANHYEWSKWRMEDMLFTHYEDLPWSIIRIGTLLCEDESGRVGQYNAIHNTLKLLYYGLLSVIPGYADTPLHLITAVDLARQVPGLLQQPAQRLVNLVYADADNLSLSEFLDTCYEQFEQDDPFRRRRILKPLFVSDASFQSMVDSLDGLHAPTIWQSLRTVSPFAKQLFISKHIQSTHTIQPTSALMEQVRNMCKYLVQHGFNVRKETCNP